MQILTAQQSVLVLIAGIRQQQLVHAIVRLSTEWIRGLRTHSFKYQENTNYRQKIAMYWQARIKVLT
jgi:hypothetical protein